MSSNADHASPDSFKEATAHDSHYQTYYGGGLEAVNGDDAANALHTMTPLPPGWKEPNVHVQAYPQGYSLSHPQTPNQSYYQPPAHSFAQTPAQSYSRTPPVAIQQHPAPLPPPEPTIFGVRKTSFLLSVALVIVIIAAAVGGGVGGSLAVQNAKSACANTLLNNSTSNPISTGSPTSPKTTVTRTVTGPSPTATNSNSRTGDDGLAVELSVLKLDCPGLNGEERDFALRDKTWKFTQECGVDFVGNDLGAVIVYSFNDCMQACAAHNLFSGSNQCMGVTFAANQTDQVPINYGNCWLKTQVNQDALGDKDLYASAALSSSS